MWRASNRGITTRSSCTMIEAVMYGITPREKMDSCSSAPPENMLTMPSTLAPWPEAAWSAHIMTLVASNPGVGTKTPSR